MVVPVQHVLSGSKTEQSSTSVQPVFVEPFDICVVFRLAGLDAVEGNAFGLSPLGRGMVNQLGSLSNRMGTGAPCASTNSSKARMPCATGKTVSIEMRSPPVLFVDDVERPEVPPGPQGLGHEAADPALMRSVRCLWRQFGCSRFGAGVCRASCTPHRP